MISSIIIDRCVVTKFNNGVTIIPFKLWEKRGFTLNGIPTKEYNTRYEANRMLARISSGDRQILNSLFQ